MKSIRGMLLLPLVMLASPVLAVGVPVLIDVATNGLSPTGSTPQRYYWETSVSGWTQGNQSVASTLGSPISVNWMNTSSIGDYTVTNVGGGLYTVTTDSPALTGSVNTASPKVTVNSQNVYFNMNGFDSGWLLAPYQHTWQDSGSHTVTLPLQFSDGVVHTAAGDTHFSLAADGTVTVGSSTGGQSMTGGNKTLTLNNLFPITFQWDNLAHNPDLWWWASDASGTAGGGPNKHNAGTLEYIAATYYIGYSNLPAGAWAGGVNYFTVPANPINWTQTLTYVASVGDTFTLQLAGPVPEPATLSLLALAGAGALARRRRTGR